jgi:diadenosine tetraphosphate (Ap4A) HIT family hydrolase
MAVNSSSEKEYEPFSKSHSSAADTSTDKVGLMSSESLSKDANLESRKQYDEIGQKNARMRKHAQSESSNAARALNQSEEASNRRKQLLHEATESAYDALELMAPHLKAIFEENFDALINRVIDVNAKNHTSADHHHWHELNVQRNTELRGAFLGGLVADSDDHVKRVFQSRQHYRAMMAKLEGSQGRTEVEPFYGNSRAEKSKPSVELDRDLHSSIKAPTLTPATFTSGDREFVTGLAKPLSNAAVKVPFPHPSLNNLPTPAQADFAHFSQMQMSRSFNRAHSGQSSARPFYNAPTPHPQSTPRDDVLVQAPQFVVVDAMKLNATPQQLHIAGSEIPELSALDNAEAAFLKARNTRSALTKPGLPHPAFKTSESKSTVHAAGLPSVGGTSLGITIAKKQPLPKLESSHSLSEFAPEQSSVSCSTTISEKDAICNIQGLVQAKSILKPVPLQTASSKTSNALSSASFQRLTHARDTQVASSLENRVLSAFDTHVPHSDLVLAPKTLSSSQILGLHDTKQTTCFDADSEIAHFVSADSNQNYASSGDLSISASPRQSPSPVFVSSFSASQAATDFNQFLASFSIEDLFNKSQVSLPTKENVTQNRLFPLAATSKTVRHVELPQALPLLNAPLPVRSDQSFKLETVPSSSLIGAELPGPPSEAVPLPVHVIPVPKSTKAHHTHDSTGIPTSAPVLSVSNQATITPVHSRVSVLFAQDTAPSASVTSAAAPPDPITSTAHASQSLGAPLESKVSEHSHVSTVESNEQAAAEFIEKPIAIAASSLQPVFDVHASTVHPERLSTHDSEVYLPSDARDVEPSSQSSQVSIQSVPQVPHTTPHASQQHSVSQPLHVAPVKAAQKPGVQGSAIRSVLLNIQNKAVTNTAQDDSRPSGIIQQQRASAVELIRQRSMQNPELRQRPSSGDVAAGLAASLATTADNRRRSSPVRKGSDHDDSDEELGTGHVFKNHKIVCVSFVVYMQTFITGNTCLQKMLQSHMSSLSREFNALRSM